ncbi:Isoleucine--Trna Ligase, Cytoplasmic [Manis pentadactyla]|nr:Isoleucine--Trna Ligase, Cytoplasmic [Manis pentadactyla]
MGDIGLPLDSDPSLMRDISITEELGSWSDVTNELQICWRRDTLALWKDLGSGSDMTGCKMVDQGYETLALRKELGSWSDVTRSARCWNSVMTMGRMSFSFMGGMTDVNADGGNSVKGPGLGLGFPLRNVYAYEIRLWREFLFNSDETMRLWIPGLQ